MDLYVLCLFVDTCTKQYSVGSCLAFCSSSDRGIAVSTLHDTPVVGGSLVIRCEAGKLSQVGICCETGRLGQVGGIVGSTLPPR